MQNGRIFVMGQSILTAHQRAVLEQAAGDRRINQNFYFTGGTALSEFYLHHRLSEDLDFFTDSPLNMQHPKNFFAEYSRTLKIRDIQTREHYDGMLTCNIMFEDDTNLKVDFVNFPFLRVERGAVWKGISIDSLFDIALNKLYVMSDRARPRDYIDLYQICVTQGISFEQVNARMNDKFAPFSYEDAPWRSTRLLRVLEQKDFPTMLVPFDKQEMIDFFLAEAKKLEPKIFSQ